VRSAQKAVKRKEQGAAGKPRLTAMKNSRYEPGVELFTYAVHLFEALFTNLNILH
jgi:hypothetical protein